MAWSTWRGSKMERPNNWNTLDRGTVSTVDSNLVHRGRSKNMEKASKRSIMSLFATTCHVARVIIRWRCAGPPSRAARVTGRKRSSCPQATGSGCGPGRQGPGK
ncbi:unnamed protein product [Prunus armeniaca]